VNGGRKARSGLFLIGFHEQDELNKEANAGQAEKKA
jgi:hypothetical protein